MRRSAGVVYRHHFALYKSFEVQVFGFEIKCLHSVALCVGVRA